jgi:cytoskeletal protein CcmA (bactofilin family)
MKKPELQEVTCPHCQGTQSEPFGAISTNCRSCGKYFKLGAKTEARAARAPKTTREVFCVKCGAPNLVATAAISTQCIRCSHYLELGNKVVRGVQMGRLYAYDDVLFEEGSSFKGMEATGRRIEVKGKVFSKLRATEEIVAMAGCTISGELHALVVRVERGATVRVQELTCVRLLVSGVVEIGGVLSASEIVLSDGAVFSGRPVRRHRLRRNHRGGTRQARYFALCQQSDCAWRGVVDLAGRPREPGRSQPGRHLANLDRKICSPREADEARRRNGPGSEGRTRSRSRVEGPDMQSSRQGLAAC